MLPVRMPSSRCPPPPQSEVQKELVESLESYRLAAAAVAALDEAEALSVLKVTQTPLPLYVHTPLFHTNTPSPATRPPGD